VDVNFVEQAGYFIWPIVGCSVIGLAIFVERCVFLLRWRSKQSDVFRQVLDFVQKDDIAKARALAEGEPGPVANVIGSFLRSLHLPREDREQLVALQGERELHRMEWGLRGLAVIARISPLLGLLGTVVGLVEAFIAVSQMEGPPDPSVLSSGIWQALLTTVAGLIVAIPAILSHEWLQGRVDRFAFVIQEAVSEVSAATTLTGALPTVVEPLERSSPQASAVSPTSSVASA
jgi:biopolymer transport protein ExbB